MKPDDIYRLPLVGDPRLSPDGILVAFVVAQADRESNSMRAQIWIAPVDGSAPPRQLTSGKKSSASPRWSPDGSSLAFVSNRDGDQMQLYVLPMDGGEPRKLTDMNESVTGAVWSPDGSQIAFVSTVRGPAYDEEDESKRPPRRIARLQFKADGSGWRSDRFNHVFVVPADGSAESRRVTDGDFNHSDVAWSRNGAALSFCANREEDWDTSVAVDVYSADVASGALRRLTNSEAMFMKPSWSPDGSRIAVRIYPDTETSPRNSQVAVIDVSSLDMRVLTAELDRQCGPYAHPREPIWRDGELLFPVEDEGNCHLYVVDADGGEPKPLITGELVVTDHDAVGDVVVHAVSTSTQPPELYCGDRRVTYFSDEFVASVRPAEAKRFTAGPVGAWVMEPKNRDPDKKYPTLVFVHGGPFAQYGNVFFDEFQVAAEAGFAVVYSNPRGSSGCAEDWGRAIRGPVSGGPGWGTVDYEDVMAVTEEAVRRFDFVDGERLGVLGGSYGGFMTAWIVGHTDRFKAACAERGIYNVLSAVGTSDGLFSSASYWGGDPWDNADTMMEVSPLTYADKITTPLLLIHSDQDHRCPVEQAEQLFTRLRMLGRDVECLRFPHGTHDLSRAGPPAQRVYRFEAINDWFARYLQS